MAITARALLRKWFGRGQYPTAEQFSSLFDSFYHKEEDRIGIEQIDALAEQINGKYDAAKAAILEEQANRATEKVEELDKDVANAFERIEQTQAQLEEFKNSTLVIECTIPGME